MKCSLAILAVVAVVLFSSQALGDDFQQWGQLSFKSRLLYREEIKWVNSVPSYHNHRIRRTFQFPKFVSQESELTTIGAVIVVHEGEGIGSEANISWGGPRFQFVGVELTSAPAKNIKSFVEVYST